MDYSKYPPGRLNAQFGESCLGRSLGGVIALKHLEATEGIINLVTGRTVQMRVMFNKGLNLVP